MSFSSALPELKPNIYQDGAQFYIRTPDTDELVAVISAPFSVPDYNLEAATKARLWFYRVYPIYFQQE